MYLTYDDFVTETAEAAKAINQAAAKDNELLNDTCKEVADRIALYLRLPNTEDEDAKIFDKRIVNVARRIVSQVFMKTQANIDGTSADTEIKSISDNGQSVTFGDKMKNYLATVEDGELFDGFSELLKPYRRVYGLSGSR